MREPETKHQLLEEERELECKVKRTAFENDDADVSFNQLVLETNQT